MSEKKNIDKLFKEQLKNFEMTPNDALWENIERELHKDKRKRRVIPIWWKFAGIAATLAILFTIGNVIFSNSIVDIINPEVVDTKTPNDTTIDQSNNKTNTLNLNTSEDSTTHPIVENNAPTKDNNTNEIGENIKQDLTSPKKTNENNSVVASENNQKKEQFENASIIKNKSQQKDAVTNTGINVPNKDQKPTKTSNTTIKTTIANNNSNTNITLEGIEKDKSEIDKLIKETQLSKTTQVTASNTEKENTPTIIDSSKVNEAIKEKNAIEEAIAEIEKEKDSTNETEVLLKRWSITPNVAPVYFNTLGKGSSLDDQLIENTKEGDVNMSYGVRGTYAINKKLKIRAGINKVDLGYTTNNILIFDGANASAATSRQLQNIQFNDSLNTNAYVSATSVNFASGPELLFAKEHGAIDQQLGFIEVPIEIEYNLIDKKIGLNLIGGFSTLFLSNNEVYSVQNNGNKTLLGEATNIKDMSYSANFGIGLNYNISKQLRFNFEPTFKYQINTFNNISGDFQPFFIGVYTGFSFKF
ncbi:hypothetical protein A9Q86_13615 [Flavobacteriales bacterium 33_180_T64]|nr:hypothetical protein A9Q86_13615 [Flavobacteriales bacterium 33_180_T64]